MVASGPSLEGLYQAARQAWPGVDLSAGDFAAAVDERIGQTGDPVAALAVLRTADVYLAASVERGRPGAEAELERRLVEAVARVVRTFPGAERFSDEALQGLREKLLLARVGGRPGIGSYSGRGPLAAWLRACAVRIVTRLRLRRVPR